MSAPAFGIYVHWPYCARICPYCDFNIYKHKGADGDALTEAILADLKQWRTLTGERQAVSLHFGGGTPSLMRADQIEAIIKTAKSLWDFTPDAEFALEANPADADAALWKAYKTAGLNRLSVGVQSFDNDVLKFLGRDHDGAGAERALDMAVSIFPRVSADLIFGHKGQALADWDADITRALKSGTGHISAYQLTVESQTAFGKAFDRGDNKAVDGDDSADLYEHSRERFTAAGFEAYEVSNYAKPGQQSRHNRLYWQAGDYAGVGPGAHGRLTTGTGRIATIAPLRPDAYIKASTGDGITASQDTLSPRERGEEYVMMGLRISEGISEARYANITGDTLDAFVIKDLCDMNLLTRDAGRIAATADGRMVLDTLTRQLLGA